MINYYHCFLPQLANKLRPLHEATKVKGQAITWTSECITAFNEAKLALTSAALLHHPDPTAMTSITVDASNTAVSGQLEQLLQGEWCPIAFFSCKLSQAQTKYSAFDRELLAIFEVIKHFRHHVEGRPFTIFADHKPLTYAFTSDTERSQGKLDILPSSQSFPLTFGTSRVRTTLLQTHCLISQQQLSL